MLAKKSMLFITTMALVAFMKRIGSSGTGRPRRGRDLRFRPHLKRRGLRQHNRKQLRRAQVRR